MRRKIFVVVAALSLFVFYSSVRAQDCAPPRIVANVNSGNLFSPEQEMILGDLTLENMSGEVRLVRDERLSAYVRGIGERLAKHLPPKGLKYQFHIIDIPEANAYSIPGGHVLLSRKLIAFVNNEDELAGVMAHELGHAAVNHSASDISDAMRKILNVTAIGDRKDIAQKYNLLIENARTKRVSRRRGHEDEQQLEADRIGLFAMVAAGYDPAAFTAFFDRLTEAEGKTGNWFSDLFGRTRPAEKRLREMIRVTEQLPQTCRDGRSAKATENFLQWQADVISFRRAERKEELPGLLWKKELSPKLRSDISYLTFSADGKYLLAQDDFAVTVIEREPMQVLFQIPAEEANKAFFTPDGKFIVFSTESLRYEKWSIDDRKPVEMRELVIRRDCWEHELSPDGKYLACVDTSTAINVIDTKTGKKIWEKKEFYPLNYLEYYSWLRSASRRDDDGGSAVAGDDSNFFRIKFTPDSRYVLFSRSDKYRFRFSVNGVTHDRSENTALALDLTALKEQNIGGDLKKLTARPFLFVDSQRILGMETLKIEDGGLFSFPEGKRLGKFAFAARNMKMTTNPDFAVIKPLANGMTGIFDLKKAGIASAVNKADLAMWNNTVAFEQASGEIVFKEVRYKDAEKNFEEKDIGKIGIPVSSIGNLNAAGISNGFKWLILSSKTRGGLWNLETGERKVFVRGFRGGIAADDGGGVGAFPKLADTPHSLALLNANNEQVKPIGVLPEKGARQYGRFLLFRKSLKEPEKKSGETKTTAAAPAAGDDSTDVNLRYNVRFELKDFLQNKIMWTRDFPKEAPRYSFDEYSGRLIFYWELGSEAGKAKLKENPELKAKAETLGDKASDYLVEVVDAYAQNTVGMMLLETGKGSFYVGEGLSERDWLILYDSEGRVLVYSLKSGELRQRFFGKHAALSPVKNQIAVENFPGEINLYNLDTGESEAKMIFNGKTAFARFSLDGKKFFVLSDMQSAYAFDLDKIALK